MDPGELKEVVDHRGEPVGLAPDLRVIVADLVRVGHHLVFERLGHRPQPGQRGAQVMADPGDELAATGLQGLLAGPRLPEPVVRLGQTLGKPG